VNLGIERYLALELFFKPGLLGFSDLPLKEAIIKAVRACGKGLTESI